MIKYELQEILPDHMVVKIDGDLVAGVESQSLRDALNPLAARFAKVTLDLGGLRKMDSSGIGVLVSAKAIADSRGNAMNAVNMTGGIRDLLLLVKLLTVLEEVQPIAAGS